MVTGYVQGSVPVSVLSVDKSLPVISLQERGDKVWITPVAGIVQWCLQVLRMVTHQDVIYE